MKFSRRDLLIGSAGVTAGLVFTPVPWKLLGDVSIWTQNWPWIPQPTHGPVTTKQSTCTLCANGCGLNVRMAGGWPVGVSGVKANPITKGALCPLAYAAHQLNWHPARVREVRHNGRTASWEEAKAAFAKACAEGPVVILDARPGRAASAVLEDFASKHKGSYHVVLGPESEALRPYAEWSGVPVSALGYDLENAKTIVSFVPLLDGWGTPGRFTRMWSERAAGSADPQLRLIQVEPTLSRTGARTWRWIANREGSEGALAAGLAQVLMEEKLVAAKGPVPTMSLSEAAGRSGLSVDAIRDLARTMVANRPVAAIAADANPSIAALNVLLGAVGTPGGIVLKNKSAKGPAALSPANKAFRAVLVDSTVPWEYVAAQGAEVFRFAAWDGGESKADWLLPAPGFLEETTDVPTAPTSGVETYAIAANLLAPAHESKTAAQFLAQIDSTVPDIDKVIHARCEEIFKVRTGTVFSTQGRSPDAKSASGAPVPVVSFESAQKLEDELRNGGIWVGEAQRSVKLQCTLKEWPAATEKSPDAKAASGAPAPEDSRPTHDWADAWAPGALPVLATKLYQESDLREAPARRRA